MSGRPFKIGINDMEIKAEISGWVVDIHVQAGQSVKKGSCLITLESMKMQIPVESPVDGVVSQVLTQKEAVVQQGDPLLFIE
jgi:acetyl-CoA carboxylase biotin carboxyl carrier protein